MKTKMSRHTKYLGLIFLASFFIIAKPSFAITPNFTDNEIPVKVNANDMVYDMDESTVTFLGNVVVTRGEFIMKSAKMTIFMQKSQDKKTITSPPKNMPLTGTAEQTKTITKKKDQNNIERIEAYNSVTFDYGSQSGKSDSAIYDAQKELLTMYGDPIVRDGENIIQGNTIRYYMNERRSEVVGSKNKRVEAIFNTKK